MATTNHNARAAHTLAAALCAVIISVYLILSQSTMEHYFVNKSKVRRRLSITDLQCPPLNRPKPQLPSLPNLLETSTYAASFPGSGYKLLTKHLVENITGMLTGEANTSPSMERMKAQHMDRTGFARGQGEVVVVRTTYPHSSGKLAAYDDWMPRAFVILRNPLHAIPFYFDELYAKNSHLPPGSSQNTEETRAAWIKWRDNEFTNQILSYRRFVSFWMEKYMGKDDQRIYFSYESLVDEETGVQEVIRLASFLERGVKANAREMTKDLKPDLIGVAVAESVKSFASIQEVPCIWKEVVHSAISGSQVSTGNTIKGEGFHGGNWSPTERPLTSDNVVEMSDMLLELINRWSGHNRVRSILFGYLQEVNRALATQE